MQKKSIQKIIDSLSNLPCVEIGGPSPSGFKIVEQLDIKLPRKIIITNISNPITLDPYGKNPKIYSVDKVVDVRNMPFSSGSVGIFLANSFPKSLIKDLFKNSSDMLCNGGLLIIENENSEDVLFAKNFGLKPLINAKPEDRFYSQIYQS